MMFRLFHAFRPSHFLRKCQCRLFRLRFAMRNNPIFHHWLTRLLYRVQCCTYNTHNTVMFFGYLFHYFIPQHLPSQSQIGFRPNPGPLFTLYTSLRSHVTRNQSRRNVSRVVSLFIHGAVQISDVYCSSNVRVSRSLRADVSAASGEGDVPSWRTFERYFINGK